MRKSILVDRCFGVIDNILKSAGKSKFKKAKKVRKAKVSKGGPGSGKRGHETSDSITESGKKPRELRHDFDKIVARNRRAVKEAKDYAIKRKTLNKKQGVPEGADPATHERCVKKVKAKGHDKSSAYAICNEVKAGVKKNKTTIKKYGGAMFGRMAERTIPKPKPAAKPPAPKLTTPKSSKKVSKRSVGKSELMRKGGPGSGRKVNGTAIVSPIPAGATKTGYEPKLKLVDEAIDLAIKGKKTGIPILDNIVADARNENRMITGAERAEIKRVSDNKDLIEQADRIFRERIDEDKRRIPRTKKENRRVKKSKKLNKDEGMKKKTMSKTRVTKGGLGSGKKDSRKAVPRSSIQRDPIPFKGRDKGDLKETTGEQWQSKIEARRKELKARNKKGDSVRKSFSEMTNVMFDDLKKHRSS